MKKSELKKLNRDEAIEILIGKIVRHAYLGVIQGVTSWLSNGPSWPEPEQAFLELHQWYTGLATEDRRKVKLIVEEAVESALFHALNVIDGTAGTLIYNTNTHLLITLQVYSTIREYELGTPTVVIPLNELDGPIVEFHDEFQQAVRELKKSWRNRSSG